MTEQEIRLATLNRTVFVVLAVCMTIMTVMAGAGTVAQLLASEPNTPGAVLTSAIAALFALAARWANKIAGRLKTEIQAARSMR